MTEMSSYARPFCILRKLQAYDKISARPCYRAVCRVDEDEGYRKFGGCLCVIMGACYPSDKIPGNRGTKTDGILN